MGTKYVVDELKDRTMPTILIISFTRLHRDPRVFRQIQYLGKSNDIIEMGLEPSDIPGVRFVPVSLLKKTLINTTRTELLYTLGRFSKAYWHMIDLDAINTAIAGEPIDLIIANDIESLPLSLQIRNKAKILLDAHEYSPSQFDNMLYWRLTYKKYYQYLCETYLSAPDAMMTVSDGIAEEYLRKFGVRSTVVLNAPAYHELEPKPTTDKIRLVYHGAANASRNIKNMIQVMDFVDERFSLDLMLVPTEKRYYTNIKKIAEEYDTVKIIPPVAMQEIIPFTNQYDIGLYILEPSNFNQTFALPNKFFEYIQARLAIAIGPSPEMSRYVKRFGNGIIASDFKPSTMADQLNALDSETLDRYKQQSHQAASELSYETSVQNLVGIITDLLCPS
jgi:hypothetical protein